MNEKTKGMLIMFFVSMAAWLIIAGLIWIFIGLFSIDKSPPPVEMAHKSLTVVQVDYIDTNKCRYFFGQKTNTEKEMVAKIVMNSICGLYSAGDEVVLGKGYKARRP